MSSPQYLEQLLKERDFFIKENIFQIISGEHLKKLFIFLFLLPLFLSAQEKTLVGSYGEMDHGGFGAPVVKFTEINGEFGVLVGGRGGWIINHTFVIGGGGYGLVNNIDVNSLLFKNRINLGYGGFEMEYIINSDEVIHFTIQALLGGGGVTYTRWNNDDDEWWDWDSHEFPTYSFFIAEPGVNLIVNIAPFFRLGFGGSYRFVSGIDSKHISNSDIAGFSGVLTFKFGSF